MVLSTEPGPEVVRIEHVSKTFQIRKDNSLKDRIFHLGKLGSSHRSEYTAVDDVDVTIQAGTTVGLLGPNGSGKSTLLKIIGGIIAPSKGQILTRGRMAALLELGAGFHPDLSGRENVYLNASILGLSREETDERFDAIHEFSGIGEFIDTQVKFYSSGMFVRLAFAVAIHTEPDILLVDEVLAVGDEAFQRKCMERIARFRADGCTIILVSHSAAQVQELCDRTLVLNQGELVFDGNANEGISALRDILEGRRVGELPRAVGEKPIELVKISLHNEDGQPVEVIRPGDPLTIRLHVSAREDLQTWAAGFSIDNPLGQMLLATNTDRIGLTMPPIVTGSGSMDFHIDSINLAAGQYFVNANVSEIMDIDAHILWQGAHFTVNAESANLGPLAATVTGVI